MVEGYNQFPHRKLKLTARGEAALTGRGGTRKNTQTAANSANRQGHGGKIKNSVSLLLSDWHATQEKREEEEKPSLSDAITLILQIDPETFDLDELRTSDIEIISELEDGYIIGASADTNLTEFQKKIDLFLNGTWGGGVVAKVLNVLDKNQRPEFILSPHLLAKWNQVRDEQFYVVEVGISCLGTQTQLRPYPAQNDYKSPENYAKAINDWISNRDLTYGEWDDLASERQQSLINFVKFYGGDILSSFEDGTTPRFSQAPDSFSCLIQIPGKGLRDLVLNFQYLFEVAERDDIFEVLQLNHQPNILPEHGNISFKLEAPGANARRVCVIDSGLQENHRLLEQAIDLNYSRSWVPSETHLTADLVPNGGHGTRVAGAILYPRGMPQSGSQSAICFLQNARVLNRDCRLDERLYPPELLEDIVEFYNNRTKTRIFNHSIAGDVSCRTRYMSAWAATIDRLTFEKDILFIVAAGNIPLDSRKVSTRLSVKKHFLSGRIYPDYLSEKSCRIANPAQSLQALTVGSVTSKSYYDLVWTSLGEKDQPSAFSCSGLGIWDTIKPDVVEYGGDLIKDRSNPPNIICRPGIGSELVRSTLGSGPVPLAAADGFGTSYAAGKVTHIATCLEAEFPTESCLLYRALIVQSARWPEWTMVKNDEEKQHVIRQIGYGIPDVERALYNSPTRSTFYTSGEERIKAREARVYQIRLPETLRSPGEEYKILVEITLSYKAQPRRTRRNRRKYLSTWLNWECSKQGEDPEYFLGRVLAKYNAPEDAEKGSELFTWTLGKEKSYKTIKGVSRSIGTIQKDWAVVDSYNLREAFCVAVIGHEGWNNDPFAEVPYSLVVSFEAVGADIPIYVALAEAQITTEVEEQVEIQAM